MEELTMKTMHSGIALAKVSTSRKNIHVHIASFTSSQTLVKLTTLGDFERDDSNPSTISQYYWYKSRRDQPPT